LCGQQGTGGDESVGPCTNEEADMITDAQVVDRRIGNQRQRCFQRLRVA
jgi:hypothetical protein